MSTYTLKSMARRGTLVVAAAALVVSAILPSLAYADALNPLTERSLLLSSSAPGYTDTDGSGNAFGSPAAIPDGTYAPAGSGPNGKKTGQTFKFKVSSDANVKSFSLQYCTSAAGKCQAPGDNTGDARDNLPSARETNAVAHAATPQPRSDLDVVLVGTNPTTFADATVTPGTDFNITVNDDPISDPAVGSDIADWKVGAVNKEDTLHSGNLTGKRNYIGMYDDSGAGLQLEKNDIVVINFEASETNYITNPGSGSFFVKINTYGVNDTDEWTNTIPYEDNTNIIDGGVTVANVMTDSIHITTKVLETMSFSVGTQNRDNNELNCDTDFGTGSQPAGCEAASGAVHGTCDPIKNVNNNRLNLGDPDAEFSLRTDRAYEVASYWRLSSNSSGGASVYYSGNTLANTVGDEIAEIGDTASVSTPGTEQFGLGFTDMSRVDTLDDDFTALVGSQPLRFKNPTLTLSDNGTSGDDTDDILLAPVDAYANTANGLAGYGRINSTDTEVIPSTSTALLAQFAFEKSSNTVPVLIAQNNEMVISCATAKMRYIANIGADTPAGVYTTKINYLAAPQY